MHGANSATNRNLPKIAEEAGPGSLTNDYVRRELTPA